MKNYLEFEKEIKTLETDLENLKSPFGSEGISEVDTQKIVKTEEEITQKLKIIKYFQVLLHYPETDFLLKTSQLPQGSVL
jgi:hypothetical protein